MTCAERETLEETGLCVKGQRLVAVTNDILHDGELVKHYVTLYILCTLEKNDSQPEVRPLYLTSASSLYPNPPFCETHQRLHVP